MPRRLFDLARVAFNGGVMLRDCLDRLDIGLPRSAGRVDLPTAMRACHTPGVGIALIADGAVAEIVCGGVREVGTTEPVTESTLFQAGSISKSVAAACALRLVADGVLGLDDDVNDGLRSWRVPDNDGWQPRVTLRQLLSHTAGMTVGGFVGYPQGTSVPSVPDLLAGRGNSGPVVVTGLPGLRYSYSGGGYVVMQQLLVDVTGQDFPTLAARLVLQPAGMRDSTFAQPLPASLARAAATGHHPGPVAVPGHWHTYPEMAAAGLWSTAGDLARFFLAIRASLDGLPGALLPRHIAEQMIAPAPDGTPYGLGLQLAAASEPASIGHGGNDQGFENHAVLYTDTGQGVAIMTNSFYGSALIRAILLPALTDAYGWPWLPTTPPSSPAPTSPAHYGDFLVEPSGIDLMLTAAGQPPLLLSASDDGHWRARNVNINAWFDDDTLILAHDGSTIHSKLRR